MTSIWPIKGKVEGVIRYAMNPEKTTEVVPAEKAALHSINGVIQYAEDDLKTEKRSYVSTLNCTKGAEADDFLRTIERYRPGDHQARVKRGRRVCFHGYQSFAPGEVTAEQAHAIGVKLAERLWGDNYEVVIATHLNTEAYHNHFVINAVPFIGSRRFDNNHSDYLRMKQESDRLCLEYGLSVIEDPAGRRKDRSEWEAERNGKPTVRGLIRQDIDLAIQISLTEREFLQELAKKGYEIKLRSDSGAPLKYPAIRPPGAKGFFRFHKLGSGYSLDEISEKILKNQKRKLPFPEDERETLRTYRRQTEPKPKLKGIHALYIRYCYELHIIQKYPASVKRVSFFMREDLAKLESLDAQTRLLADNRIETMEELHAFQTQTETEIQSLEERRKDLRNELKRTLRRDDGETAEQVRSQIAEISTALKKKKKQLSLTQLIEARSAPMEQALHELEEQQTERKEERPDELFGRSGRTGRENEPRRG